MRFCRIAVLSLVLASSLTIAAWGQSTQAPATLDPAQVTAVTKYLATHAVPLKSVQAGNGFEDLKPLERVMKGVRVVGLGEATHGTREFFQFKHRMLEFLVEKMGFTAFAIEASYPACMNINDYVVYGKGDPATALASQGFWTWNTEEVLGMMKWMREYNNKLPEEKRIRFLGFDMQGGYNYAMDAIREYLRKVAPDHLPEAEKAFLPLVGRPLPIIAQPADEIVAAQARLQALHSFLLTNRSQFAGKTSEWETDVVLLDARVLVQGVEFFAKMPKDLNKTPASAKEAKEEEAKKSEAEKEKAQQDFVAFAGLRDRYMAENIETLMGILGSKTKMVIWGHNGHVAAGPWVGGVPSMGSHLRQTYGNAYYVLGFDFDHGKFQAMSGTPMKLQECAVGPAPEGSVAWYMKQAIQVKNYTNYVVDFRSAPKTGVIAEWLAKDHLVTFIGAGFLPDAKRDELSQALSLRKYFDAMVFINESTRARPNPPLEVVAK